MIDMMMAVGYTKNFCWRIDEYYDIWFSKLSIFPARLRNEYIHNTKYIYIITVVIIIIIWTLYHIIYCTVIYSSEQI